MQYKKVIIFTLILLSFGLTRLQAQEAIPTTGGNSSGSGGSASYTVGQVSYITNTGTTGTVAQGVQQPYEISIITGLPEYKSITLQCSVYPNPTTNFIMLHVENYMIKNLTYQLYDMNGKIIVTKKIDVIDTKIPMSDFKPATYYLIVTDNKKEVKTFKIIKM